MSLISVEPRTPIAPIAHNMKIVVYGIGGNHNEKIVGTAHDSATASTLVAFVEASGGSGVSLHGSVCLLGEPEGDGFDAIISGAYTFREAREIIEGLPAPGQE